MTRPDTLFRHYRLRSQFKRGRWPRSLPERAAAQLARDPCSLTLGDYIDTVHAISGHSAESLQKVLSTAQSLEYGLSAGLRCRIAALCLQYRTEFDSRLLHGVAPRQLLRYPSLLAAKPYRAQDTAGSRPQRCGLPQFETLARGLLARTRDLSAALSARPRPGRICIVGNAPTEAGKDQRHLIDSADLVFRFNNAVTSAEHQRGYGTRTDFWTVSPSYRLQADRLIAREIVISGVHPFDKPTLYWQRLAAIGQVRYYTFPAQVWYSLVAQLQAPPSAGLLCLATLMQWRKQNTDIETYGISLDSVSRQNHYADSGKRSSRHNWAAESALARQLILD